VVVAVVVAAAAAAAMVVVVVVVMVVAMGVGVEVGVAVREELTNATIGITLLDTTIITSTAALTEAVIKMISQASAASLSTVST